MKRSQKILVIVLLLGLAVVVVSALFRNPNTGTLQLEVTPKDATVTVDNKPVEGTKWRLIPGSHSVNITKDGYMPENKSVAIVKGKTTKLIVQMSKETPAKLVDTIFRDTIYRDIPAPELEVVTAKSLYGGLWVVGAVEIGDEEVRTVILKKDQSGEFYSLHLVGPPFNPNTLLQLPEEVQALAQNDDWIGQ